MRHSLWSFLVCRRQDDAHAPRPSRPLTPAEGREATRPSSRLLLRLLQSLNSPARKSRRKRGETLRRRFALAHNLDSSAVLLLPAPVVSRVSIPLLQSRVGGWIKNWWWKGKNEAHLPADDNPSVSSAGLSPFSLSFCPELLHFASVPYGLQVVLRLMMMFISGRLFGTSRSRSGSTRTSLRRRFVRHCARPSCLSEAAKPL